MTLPRRTFVRLAASAAAAPAISRFAWAHKDWAATDPSQPVRIVVGFAPGSSPDIIARLIAQSLSERTGQEFIVDNRTGIGGNVATETVVNAAPDGRTLLMVGPRARSMRRSTTGSASISAAISRRSPPLCAPPMSCW